MPLLQMGDLAQARSELDAALQKLRANGDRVNEARAFTRLSVLARWQGDETRALALARQALDFALLARARDTELMADLAMGDAEAALGRLAASRQAYMQALAVALAIGDPRQHDARAGLARVALAEGDIAAALEALQPLLHATATCTELDGTSDPRQIELTCHCVLVRAGDPSAAMWLQRAHTALMAQADAIGRHSPDEALRQGFLQNIPYHREIVAAWVKRNVVDAAPATPEGRMTA